MSNPHEPSYYEIALTNRQVVVAFVVLLACLLTAFFSGVWVGRGGAARAGAETVAQVAAPPQRTEGAAMEELQFFDRDKGKGKGKGEARDERPTTLQEDLSQRGTAPAPTRESAPAAVAPAPIERAPVEPPAALPPATLPPVAAAPRAVTPPVPSAHAETPAPSRPAPADRDAEPAAGSTVIQVFATPDRQEAARVRNRLQSGGQKAYLSPVTVGGRTMFRVRIGPFASKDDAQHTAEVVRKTFKLDTWVTK